MQYSITNGSLPVMVLKPRWVHALNFREQDKAVLDDAILLARKEGRGSYKCDSRRPKGVHSVKVARRYKSKIGFTH